MPKITSLGAGSAPANTDVIVLGRREAGTANTQKVTVNTFFSNVTANAKFANAEITTLTVSTANVQSLALGAEYINSNGALSTSIPLSILQGGTANAVVTTLANTTVMGQVKVIVAYHVNQVHSVTMDSTLGDGVTYTFQTEGESLSLLWTGDHWIVTSRGSNETGSNVQGTMDAT
jgi:hypothetical protein